MVAKAAANTVKPAAVTAKVRSTASKAANATVRACRASKGAFGRQMGRHSGRGPKGYMRSDERIREDVNDRLTDDPDIDASEIEVNVSNCEVTLTGTVDSPEAKRRAEECTKSVSGVRNMPNNLRVQHAGESQQSGEDATRTGKPTGGGRSEGEPKTE